MLKMLNYNDASKHRNKCSNAAAAAKSLLSCPTLCDPRDGSPPGSPVPGILQARTLEWVAISFFNAWKWKVKVKSLSLVGFLENSTWAISNSKRWCCKSAALNMPGNLENSEVATGLEMLNFHCNPKEEQCQKMFTLPHNCTYFTC